MTSEKLFEAFGNIDEKYIREARELSMNSRVKNSKGEKQKMRKLFRRPAVAVAALAICVCITGVTALATTDKVKGFFKDIIRWDGAVVGTEYEQATDELNLTITSVPEEINVEVKMVNPDVAPYGFFELFGIASYKIMDSNGNVVVEASATEMVEITDGVINLKLPCNDLPAGEYELVVNKMVGSAKADQPLELSGVWKCGFTVK